MAALAIRFEVTAFFDRIPYYSDKGGNAVDLSLRMNVLAVCAVFVFVGAILLGAF